jgi:prevent-host-death family protein
MNIVGAFEAKNTFGSLLDRVEAGEEILITRHGRPAARLTQPPPVFDRERARASRCTNPAARQGVKERPIRLGRMEGIPR